MAVIALTSAKGAPGVTTTCLALTLAWPRPVLLVEADVAGSSSVLAGYLHGSARHDKGLVDLAQAYRHGQLHDGITEAAIALPDSPSHFIAGLTSPAQAAIMQPVWEPLAAALHHLEHAGVDVIVDAGRLGALHGPVPLLREADLTLLTTRTTLPAIAATRVRGALLRDDLAGQGFGQDALRLLLVGEGQPYSTREISEAVKIPVAAAIAWDPETADVFAVGAAPGRRFNSSPLIRTVHAAATTIQRLIAARRARLTPGSYAPGGQHV